MSNNIIEFPRLTAATKPRLPWDETRNNITHVKFGNAHAIDSEYASMYQADPVHVGEDTFYLDEDFLYEDDLVALTNDEIDGALVYIDDCIERTSRLLAYHDLTNSRNGE